MSTKENIKGYKVFNPDLTCRGFQYEIGKEYKHEGTLKVCSTGFHFCIEANHCFAYYDFNPKNIVCEVEALGDYQTHEGDSKIATNHIKIIRQLTWEEVLKVSNKGEGNTGHSNAGNDNAGNSNAGYYNAGNDNAGNRNAGYYNAGNDNAGNRNAGNSNAGNSNAGNRNAGNSNAGYYNAGNSNAGYSNAGNDNAGYYNAGNRNAGYSNAGNDNAGAFNTVTEFKMFDKKTDWTFEKFRDSKAFKLLHDINTSFWIPNYKMSEQEKIDFPYYKTTGGYFKVIPYKEAFTNQWHNWSEENKKEFTSLPNFDAVIFEEITGVKI